MVSHVDPEVLALRALGDAAGTTADDAHLPGCAECQAELDRLRAVVTVARADDHQLVLDRPADAAWYRITQELGADVQEPVPDDRAVPDAIPGSTGRGPASMRT
jgi:hypothetical protein